MTSAFNAANGFAVRPAATLLAHRSGFSVPLGALQLPEKSVGWGESGETIARTPRVMSIGCECAAYRAVAGACKLGRGGSFRYRPRA
jgi:hypothetical protein